MNQNSPLPTDYWAFLQIPLLGPLLMLGNAFDSTRLMKKNPLIQERSCTIDFQKNNFKTANGFSRWRWGGMETSALLY